LYSVFLLYLSPRPPTSTLFPYTTLFRSGISEWIDSLERSFPEWHIYISSKLTDSEYAAGQVMGQVRSRLNVRIQDALHLAVSMRSEEHTSELQSLAYLVCRLLLEKKKKY